MLICQIRIGYGNGGHFLEVRIDLFLRNKPSPQIIW